ncbi:peptidase M10A and M12B matrixin and adamalysin [Halobacteriales archaeon QS_5_68_33]|nr:MAG: peptidase M10A and M12B matrixin and adamalysin [Halobacteriales archaeon QS_5_68_33]
MNRRAFLAGCGAVASLGVFGRGGLASDDPLRIRVWLSDRAAEYDKVGSRACEHLDSALAPVGDGVQVTMAEETVTLPAEGGRQVLARHWPRRVLEGAVGGDVNPTTGVNLLVTDGDPTEQPAGYGRRYVAASTGARYIAEMDLPEEAPGDLRYSVAGVATQLLLHECGHALGLTHAHGRATVSDGRVVASPMVGSYLWRPAEVRRQYLDETNACGDPLPPPTAEGERRLGLRYSPCALGALPS